MKLKPNSINAVDWPKDLIFRVRFKKAGQGDSIILEAVDNGKRYIGIVDCKNHEGADNSVIGYLNYLVVNRIDFLVSFVILAQPSNDCCLGTANLIEYLVANNIRLDSYAYSFDPDGRHPEISSNVISILHRTTQKLRASAKPPNHFLINHKSSLYLSPAVGVECLAPQPKELNEYAEGIRKNMQYGKAAESTLSGLLSTVLAVHGPTSYVLLTSDAERDCFYKMGELIAARLPKKTLHAAQIPNHGSARNFHEGFWKSIARKKGCKAVFSVGVNDDKNPSQAVVKRLEENYHYITLRTNHLSNVLAGADSIEWDLVEISESIDSGETDTIIDVRKE